MSNYRFSDYRCSHENDDPARALWIPAFAGMTTQVFLLELGYDDVQDAQVPRAQGSAGAAE
jgi:hypothetical protein